MFKYSAFTENTPEMRRYLESIGYEPLSYNIHWDYLCTGKFNGRPIYRTTTESQVKYLEKVRIDCRTNPELFKAIAAIRDDTSANQYWVFNEDFDQYRKGDFVLGIFHRCSCYCHVATKEELIKHFKPYANKAND